MKFLVQLIFAILFAGILNAQEPVVYPLPKEDTLKFGQPLMVEPGLNFSGILPEFSLWDFQPDLTLSTFDFSDILKSRWQVNGSIDRFFIFPAGILHFPYPGTGMIFNHATWQATPKLTVGGSSFGISSPSHAPLPATYPGNYNTRGMSVFLEYKIGKNLRIGGGVTVTGHQP